MEITLDKRYEVTDTPAETSIKTTIKTPAQTPAQTTIKTPAQATEEKPDENGWTQSQQKALER